MPDPTAVIFDYYETIAELGHETRERGFDELAQRIGRPLPPGEAYREWRDRTTRDALVRFGSEGRPPRDGTPPPFVPFRQVWLHRFGELFRHWEVDAPAEVGAQAYADLHAGAAPYPDALPALDALRPRYRLAVLSDADSDFLSESMGRHGVSVEVVVDSEMVRAYKPHVSLFRNVCERLGVEPEQAVYVGDSAWADVEGARHAGLHAIWLNRHAVDWPDDIAPPEHMILSLVELPEALAQL